MSLNLVLQKETRLLGQGRPSGDFLMDPIGLGHRSRLVACTCNVVWVQTPKSREKG